MKRARLRLPVLPPQLIAWARAGTLAWSCSQSCWLNYRLELITGTLRADCRLALGHLNPRLHRGVFLQPVDDRNAGVQFALDDAVRTEPVEHHHQRAQRVAVRDHEHMLAAQHARLNLLDVIRQHARGSVAQTFTAGRGDIIGAAPDMHLLLAP